MGLYMAAPVSSLHHKEKNMSLSSLLMTLNQDHEHMPDL